MFAYSCRENCRICSKVYRDCIFIVSITSNCITIQIVIVFRISFIQLPEEAEMLKKGPRCVNLSEFLLMYYFCGNNCFNVSKSLICATKIWIQYL